MSLEPMTCGCSWDASERAVAPSPECPLHSPTQQRPDLTTPTATPGKDYGQAPLWITQ